MKNIYNVPSAQKTNLLWLSFQEWLETFIEAQVRMAVEKTASTSTPTPVSVPDKNFTIQEACDYLHTSKPTVHRLLNEGRLHRIKVGRATRISKNEIDKAISKGLLSNSKKR